MENYKINNENKDRLFKFIFGRPDKKKWLLSLYNAVNHSQYDNPDDITITTIEDAVYMSMKNDLSFLIDSTMSFYEHQSTYNPNIPLRMMIYAGMVYSKLISDRKKEKKKFSLYSTLAQKVPVPKFICFYNGLRDIGESRILKLSEELPGWKESDIDAKVLMLNINWGRNRKLMDSCRPLSEYSQFVADMRQLYEETEDKDLAVETAVRNLPEDSEIRALLEANMAEVKMNCLTEYNDEEEKEVLREQYLEAGRAEGADRLGALGTILLKEGRTDDLQKAFTDSVYREKLFREFGIA